MLAGPSLVIGRYLTPEEKEHEIGFWKRRLAKPIPPGLVGGEGFPDLDMVPYCETLNQIPGLCTVQSCAGHKRAFGDDFVYDSGVVWLRLDERMFRIFYEEAPHLARHPNIESVSTRYGRWTGGDVAEIYFHGNERGKLSESMAVVLAFFTRSESPS